MGSIPLVGEGGKGQLLLSAPPLPRDAPLRAHTAWSLGCSGCRGVPSIIPSRSAGGRGLGGACSPRRWASPPCASDRPEQPPSLLRKPLHARASLCLGSRSSWLVPSAAVPSWGRRVRVWGGFGSWGTPGVVSVRTRRLRQKGTGLLSSAGLLQTWCFLGEMHQS